jgi:hypothetical protein
MKNFGIYTLWLILLVALNRKWWWFVGTCSIHCKKLEMYERKVRVGTLRMERLCGRRRHR